MVSAAARLARPVPRNRGAAAPAACAVSLRGLYLLAPHRRLPGGRAGSGLSCEQKIVISRPRSPQSPRARSGVFHRPALGSRCFPLPHPRVPIAAALTACSPIGLLSVPAPAERAAARGLRAAPSPPAEGRQEKALVGFGEGEGPGGAALCPGCHGAPGRADGRVGSLWASGPCEELEVPKHEQKLLCGAFVR